MMAITALTDVETLEVSLVPEGANLKKRFPVLKTAEKKEMSDILHAVIDAPSSEDTKFDQVVKSSSLGENPEAAEALKGAMKILNAYSDSISPEDAIGVMAEGFGVQKAEYKKAEEEEEEEEEEDAEKASEFEEGKESEGTTLSDEGELDKASEFEEGKESEGTKLSDEDELDKAEEDEEEDEEAVEKSLKSLPANVRNQMTTLRKSNREIVAKAAKLEKALKVERDERLRKEFVEKAQKEFPYVPGKSPEEIGLMLKTLHGVAPKIASDIEGIFKSVSATIEKTGLLKELGSGMTGRGDSASAYGKLDSMARGAVQKSGGSYAKAFEAAMKTNPELYSQYLEEQGQ